MRQPAARQNWIGLRWGAPCSALFHAAIVAFVLLMLPEPRKPKALPKEIPVEIVRKDPSKKPAEKPKKQVRKTPPKPKTKPTAANKEPAKPPKPAEKKPLPKEKLSLLPKKKAAEKPPAPRQKPAAPPEKKLAEKKPPILKEEKAKPASRPAIRPEAKKPAEKPTEKPAARKPAKAPSPGEKEPQGLPKPPIAEKEPQLALGPKPPVLRPQPPALRPKPAPPPKPKSGSLKVPPQIGAVPHPDAKKRKLLGEWILRPLVLDTGHRCGIQRVTGTMNLVNRRVLAGGAEIQYLAHIRTTIYWERCRPEGALSKLVLIRRGDRVFLVSAKGVMDQGLMRGNVMILRDSLGDSVWRLSK